MTDTKSGMQEFEKAIAATGEVASFERQDNPLIERIQHALSRLRDAVAAYDVQTIDTVLHDTLPEFRPAEAASALAYWTDFPLDDPLYEGFDHTVTSLVWGGKRDYATWFSAEPAAMLAILLIPVSPSSDHLAGDPIVLDQLYLRFDVGPRELRG